MESSFNFIICIRILQYTHKKNDKNKDKIIWKSLTKYNLFT